MTRTNFQNISSRFVSYSYYSYLPQKLTGTLMLKLLKVVNFKLF